MISEKHIERINNVIKDMVFDFNNDILEGATTISIQYQFLITGQKKMISVGEYYDYLVISVKIIDGDYRSTQIFSIFKDLGTNILNDYKFKISLDRSISEELQYFFGRDSVRIIINSIEFSDEYENKIESFD